MPFVKTQTTPYIKFEEGKIFNSLQYTRLQRTTTIANDILKAISKVTCILKHLAVLFGSKVRNKYVSTYRWVFFDKCSQKQYKLSYKSTFVKVNTDKRIIIINAYNER